MADSIIDEVLKFDPGRTKPKSEKIADDDIIGQVLQFDPGSKERVGGTFQPSEDRGFAGTAGVPGEFISQTEPEAGFNVMMKTSFVDNPYVKARIYAESRGIPINRYRVTKKGDIEFRDDQGKWQREVSEMPWSKIKQTLASIIAHPSTALGTAGAIFGGPVGAVAGAVTGEAVRKGVGALKYGEEQTTLGNLMDIGLEGIFALGGEVVGKVLKGGVNRYLARKAKALRLAGAEVRARTLTPKDHAKAVWVQQLAEQHNITLAPHQLYDKEGMTNVWRYLRKHPVTSDAVRTFEDNLANQSDEGITAFIRDMGGLEKTPYGLGREVKEVAGEVIEGAETARTRAVSPEYRKAFKATGPVDVRPVLTDLDSAIDISKGRSKSALLKVKKDLYRAMTPEEKANQARDILEGGYAEYQRLAGEADRMASGVAKQRRMVELEDFARNVKRDSMDSLRVGTLTVYDAIEDAVKMGGFKHSDVAKTWGPTEIAEMVRRRPGLISKKGDIRPDSFATQYGFEGDTEMLEAILASETQGSAAGRAVDQAWDEIINAGALDEPLTRAEILDSFSVALREMPQGKKPRVAGVQEVGDITPSGMTPEDRLEALDAVKKEIDAILEGPEGASIAKDTKFKMAEVKRNLTSIMDEASPEYAAALAKYAELSPPIDRLKESVIGQISKLKTDKTIADVPKKLLNIRNMPDDVLVIEARKVIEAENPELWKQIVGSYIGDIYQGLRIAEEGGKVLNVPGKMYKALYGNKAQRKILKAAMTKSQFENFEGLMQVFQRASVGVGKESMTAPFQAISEMMGVIPGSKFYRAAMFPRSTVVETIMGKWNNVLVAGRQTELIEALVAPDAIKKLAAMKKLSPGSQKFIEAFSVFSALIFDKVDLPEKQPERSETQRRPQ